MTDWQTMRADVIAAAPVAEFKPGNLEAKFIAPPFTVLDTRQGYWQERRRSWLSLGIESEIGRGLEPGVGNARSDYGGYQVRGALDISAAAAATGYATHPSMRAAGKADAAAFHAPGEHEVWYDKEGAAAMLGKAAGISIFDPVLCELVYRWFAPEGGRVLDPFAGGSVRGIVAAKLGHPYTGIDLSERQVAANREQATAIVGPSEPQPTWIHHDSRYLADVLPAGGLFDLVFTCPPYYDLEVYSEHPADLSNAGAYSLFVDGYGEIIKAAAHLLADQRFMVIVVSEIRDGDGYCRGLVPDTIRLARAAGLHLYNEAVLVNSAGSLPLRVTAYMESSRKLGRAHQNILVFVKGKPPRGWSYDRAAPPPPQTTLFGDAA